MRMDDMDVLEQLLNRIWEDGARNENSAGERNGFDVSVRGNGARKKRASWRLLKEQISPRGQVLFENSVFRLSLIHISEPTRPY